MKNDTIYNLSYGTEKLKSIKEKIIEDIKMINAAIKNNSAEIPCVIHDLEANIEGAKKYGMQGFQFKAPDTTELRSALRDSGVNI